MSPHIFMIPDNPYISWASMMIAALLILDVSTEVGEYHSAIKQSPRWSKDARRVCKAINIVALQVVTIGMLLVILSAAAVTQLTEGIDHRMTVVLEGISRLEAAHLMAYVSVKTPRWIGVYHSPEKHRCIQHVGEGIEALKFHVRYSISQYLVLVYCLMLPFTGRPISALIGFALGFIIELLIVFARGGGMRRRVRVSLGVSVVFTFLSSVMFADGCHYIQVVWASGIQTTEWRLGISTFFSAFAAILIAHLFHLRRTEKKYSTDRRIDSYDQKERMAISLIRSHLFGSWRMSKSQKDLLKDEKEQSQDENGKTKINATPTTSWSLFKKRLFASSDLVVFSRFEYYCGVIISVASIFVVVINIGASRQMNVVRKNLQNVHDTLYAQMDEGPVCGFDQIGGIVSTFESGDAAHSAGYTVGHCGACGQCSTWQDLRLQFTTRHYLAKESARCARKSMIYGRDAVHTCLEEEPIGFSNQCAECWTEDIFCARSHCAFIFLQSNMINTVSNFQVGDETITAATCEEAMCELEFVPCSGANRRRMNITSTIARSGRQMCSIIDVDWAEFFSDNNSKIISGADVQDKNDEL